MFDLTKAEAFIAREAGLPFTDLLTVLDKNTSANIHKKYEQMRSRYTFLANKGLITNAEQIELDRIDSSLCTFLDQGGLFVFAARLMRIIQVVRFTSNMLLNRSYDVTQLMNCRICLGLAIAISHHCLVRKPLPFDSAKVSDLLKRATEAISALLNISQRQQSLTQRLFPKHLSDYCTTLFIDSVQGYTRDTDTYRAAVGIIDSSQTTARQRIQRVKQCFMASGLTACSAILLYSSSTLHQVSELICEGFGE
jgi:hypothetical protein